MRFVEFPFGPRRWSPLAALIMANPLPGAGVWCPRLWFELYDAANDPNYDDGCA